MHKIGITILLLMIWVYIQISISGMNSCSTFSNKPSLCSSGE